MVPGVSRHHSFRAGACQRRPFAAAAPVQAMAGALWALPSPFAAVRWGGVRAHKGSLPRGNGSGGNGLMSGCCLVSLFNDRFFRIERDVVRDQRRACASQKQQCDFVHHGAASGRRRKTGNCGHDGMPRIDGGRYCLPANAALPVALMEAIPTMSPVIASTLISPKDAGRVTLPPEAPMPMPEQSLRKGRLQVPRQRTAPVAIGFRRLYLIGGTAAMTGVAAWVMLSVMWPGGISVLEACLMALFVPLFAWIAMSFFSALAGFVSVVFGAGRKLGIEPDAPLPQVNTRTALLMPTYNEDPRRLLAGLQAIYESVAETGQLDRFDFFVLSDTTREAIGRAEEQVYAELCERVGGHGRLFYRRRADNSARKAGNIADWVRRFGDAYPQMLILDADSLMTGDTIVRLVAGMEANPDVGLIQTLPEVVNGQTLFARMQQFGGRVYGPVIAYGVAWWQGAESNYWGHNAVIRTRAFAENAGLPSLPGRKPFGGHVLSHDFVEAALMRRGGWATHMVPYLQGSYEEGPPTLTDLLIRDRRWCQGNLQHAKVVLARGLHWISRMHMMVGIGHYFTAPMWAMLMLIGIAIPLQGNGIDLAAGLHFSPAHYWHGRTEGGAVWIFVCTMFVLLAPKFFGYLALLVNRRERIGCGGAFRALVSILLETVLAALMAPIVMYLQSRGVAEVLAGKDSGWDAQQRDDGRLSWGALIRGYGGLSLFGLLIGGMAYAVSPALAAWMSPVVIGMVLAVPVVALTSLRRAGLSLRRGRIFSIPAELEPPRVLTRAAELRKAALSQPSLIKPLRRFPARIVAPAPYGSGDASASARLPALLGGRHNAGPDRRNPEDAGSAGTRDWTCAAMDRAVAAWPGRGWQRFRTDRARVAAPALAGPALRVSARAGAADHDQQRRAHARLVRHRRHGYRRSCRYGRRRRVRARDRSPDPARAPARYSRRAGVAGRILARGRRCLVAGIAAATAAGWPDRTVHLPAGCGSCRRAVAAGRQHPAGVHGPRQRRSGSAVPLRRAGCQYLANPRLSACLACVSDGASGLRGGNSGPERLDERAFCRRLSCRAGWWRIRCGCRGASDRRHA